MNDSYDSDNPRIWQGGQSIYAAPKSYYAKRLQWGLKEPPSPLSSTEREKKLLLGSNGAPRHPTPH